MYEGASANCRDNPPFHRLDTAMRQRVLSGMRPTGALHLGHYHGALKNWVRLQDYDRLTVADRHALTTHYEDRQVIERTVYDMVIDWLAAGLDPEKSTIFIQSRLPEHAEPVHAAGHGHAAVVAGAHAHLQGPG